MLDDSELLTEIREMLDRDQITRVLVDLERGVDRLDEELIRSAFHPDGFDDHGIGGKRNVDEYIEWQVGTNGPKRPISTHVLGGIRIQLDGDVAQVESHIDYTGALYKEDGTREVNLGHGRFLDRFERRDGKNWKIARRVLVHEWDLILDNPRPQYVHGLEGCGTRDRTDPSYYPPGSQLT